ncbi:DEAD/DEAH box helicase [Algoriphagus formosus]|uniref:DEAD/DEAH box helicase n=1 Tax=Algoriphagus formosus TaxID=2007308 RepID=UPI000C2854F1|nr:DEAD/DEAH box helicase family protein [Algoriphagus formosus]
MSLQYKQDDFVLKISDYTDQTNAIVGKYEAYLDAITTENFEHVREAIRRALRFLVTDKYRNTQELAEENWHNNSKLQLKYNALEQYLLNIQIKDKKAASIDLATGTGKSWVIYGVAQLALAEGLVDKVLVLCPSLTIEEELKKKFEQLAGSQTNQQILKELGGVHPAPSIKNANVPILSGDICVENIHAVYQRTGSSIQDSFLGKGQRTLVISDEAHHIYSPDEAATKKWFDFIINPDYDFAYHIGVTGTPYIGNDYFHDVIYRYGIKQAIEDGVVKKIDYKLEEADQDKGWDETWHNHNEIANKYSGKLKPLTIVVADRIYRTVEIWKELSEYISKKEKISFEEASKKVIWVASGIPSNKQEKGIIESIIESPEKARKENLSTLKTVDEPDNSVEWIISVAMLTEGWDVKNVFQIVPHEQRAFNSKLLIAQVLGRGLRIPKGVEQPVYVRINNHEKWSQEIKDLYEEVLELENRISYGYSENRKQYDFPLYNLDYVADQKTVGSEKQPSSKEPKIEKLKPQNKVKQTYSEYSESGSVSFEIEIQDNEPIESAARQIKLFLKDKDPEISKEWPIKRIQEFLSSKLDNLGYDSTYVSRENLSTFKQAFGPMFREAGKQVVRLILKAHNTSEIKLKNLPTQTFSESSIKRNGYLFYSKEGLNALKKEEYAILKDYLEDKDKIQTGGLSVVKEVAEKYGGNLQEVDFLDQNLIQVDDENLKTIHNLVYVSFDPERQFLKALQANIDLIDSFLKSPDKGFYSFPYSYKPAETGSSHVKRENFNPDFFLKLKGKNEMLVVEIKADGDSHPKNRAKYRDAQEHFKVLNEKLQEKGVKWTYHFYFLSPDNYTDFFQSIRNGKLYWKSELMQILDNSNSPF